jgi:hypothetical protein
MSDFHIVTVVPVYYQRQECVPLHNGPWLMPKPPAHAWVPLTVAGWLVLLAASQGSPALVGMLVGGAVLVALLVGLVQWTKQAMQVCPQCLSGMALAATRCPQCQYTPDVVQP